MLSIKGIYDGEKIIPKEPINLGSSENFEVIITFVRPIEKVKKRELKHFCGIWEDDRSAEEIVKQIYKQRENFNIQEVKL